MNNKQPSRYRDFSSSGRSEKESFYQRQISEQDEDHINDEFMDQPPADYTGYQVDSKPTQAEAEYEESNYNGQIDDSKSLEYQEKYGKSKDKVSSDKIIEVKICEILNKDSEIDASDIQVTVNKGTVLLSGTVRDRDERFRAEMAIEEIAGVEDIQNNIRLRKVGS